jgi:hypothetical protein
MSVYIVRPKVTADDLTELWGDSITRIPIQGSLATILPEQARMFLGTVGLPEDSALMRINLASTRLLPSHCLDRDSTSCWIIGAAKPRGDVCLDGGTGRVMMADIDFQLPPKLINSGPSELGGSLVAFERFLRQFGEAPAGEHSDDVVAALEHALTKIDPEALSDPNGWWAQVIEGERHGM